jgi:hypothetical protein
MATVPQPDNRTVADALAAAVNAYREHGSIADLLDDIARVAEGADATQLMAAVEPFLSIPEVAGPVYERILDERPDDARAMVILANAYWLSGRGPDVVGELATRALTADPANRGAWHLWALSESDQRERTGRWMQVAARFPADDLAKANLADNAASLASSEHDREALSIAISTYEALLSTATIPAQRDALNKAITTLRGWKI